MKKSSSIRFVYRIPAFGPSFGTMGQCEIRIRESGLAETIAVVRHASLQDLSGIATQFYLSHLLGRAPSRITWVLENADHSFQKVQMNWDGERYSLPKPLARLNREAFELAFDWAS